MTLPAKLQTYLACGTPILAAAGGESARVVGENGIGFVCPPQLEALVETVKQALAMSPADHEAMSRSARAYYEAHFTMDRLVTELEEMLKDEMDNRRTEQ